MTDSTSTSADIEPAAVAWMDIFHHKVMAVIIKEIIKIPKMNVLINTGTGYLIIRYDVAA